MQVTEYIHNGAIIVVYRPELTEEERKKRENNIKRALDCYGKERYEKKAVCFAFFGADLYFFHLIFGGVSNYQRTMRPHRREF